jgi:hypothetical protein
VAGGGIYIKYDSVEDARGEKAAVGRMIVEALERAGLQAEWSGDPETAIHVPLEWRKRRQDD